MAGFWAGFGEQFSTNVEQRQKTLDRLIEENLDNARLAKSNYAKRKGTADTVLKSAKAIRDKFGLDDAQVLALTEGYGTDLPRLQASLDKQQAQLKSAAAGDLTPSTIMSYVNAADNLSLPEGMTLEQGVNRLMGLHAQELAKEAQPKSEGSKVRSFVRAAMAYDPQLQAADKIQDIEGPGGMSYAQLLEMQEAGFAPDEVFGDVTRAGGITLDYTTSTAKQTRTDYARRLAVKLYEADEDGVINFDKLSPDVDKTKVKASIQGTSESLARLEREIVLANLGTDLSMSAFRNGILNVIYSRVDEPEELDTLRESINNGTALKIVQETGGKLTDRDIDAIILGAEPTEGPGGGLREGQNSLTSTAAPTPVTPIPETSILDEDTQATYDSLPDEDKPDLTGVEDPDVARMIVEQAAEKASMNEGEQSETTTGSSSRRRRRSNRTQDVDATPENLQSGISAASRGRNVPRQERSNDDKPTTEDTITAIKTQSQFIQTHFDDVLDYFEETGVDKADKNDIKLALAEWFSDNAEKLEVPSTLRTEDIAETIFKAFNDKES